MSSFQSLSRDSVYSNSPDPLPRTTRVQFQSLSRDSVYSNPTYAADRLCALTFQSLSRDSVYSNSVSRSSRRRIFSFQSLSRDSVYSNLLRCCCRDCGETSFNPSVGIAFIQTNIRSGIIADRGKGFNPSVGIAFIQTGGITGKGFVKGVSIPQSG